MSTGFGSGAEGGVEGRLESAMLDTVLGIRFETKGEEIGEMVNTPTRWSCIALCKTAMLLEKESVQSAFFVRDQ